MGLSFWERLSIITGLLVLAALFGLMFFVANIEIKDLDLWLHIGTGRWIVNNGFQIPQTDVLSCTITGKPWINHEWLFQVIVYWLFNKWGAEGILNAQSILISVTAFILLILGYNKDKQLATIFPLVLVAIVYFGRFTNRPDLFSLFFFAFYIFLLSFFLNQRWTIYAMFICQVLWNNMHGFFFFGPLFVLIGLSAEWIKRHVPLPYEWNKIGCLTNQEYKNLKLIFLFVFLACFINPYTFRGAWYPIRVFFELSGQSRIFFQNIVELQKPITWGNIFSFEKYPYYKLLIMISALSFFFNRDKLDIGNLMFWLVFLGFSLAAIRNMIFFAFAAYLAFVTNALTLSMRDLLPLKVIDKKFIHVTSIVVKLCILGWLIQYGTSISLNGYYDFDKYDWKSEFGGISQRQYPVKAADFFVENNVRANLMNGFNTGAYLVGRCSPNIKVYIDGRTEVYGPEFFSTYKNLWENGDPKLLQETIDKYDIDAIFIHTIERQAPDQFLKSVHALKDFVPVYLDFDGIIYLKDMPKHQEVIKKYRLDFENWDPQRLDIFRMGYRRVIPYRSINRAYTLETLGYPDAALLEIEETLKMSPTYIEPYKLRGKIFAERKEYMKAFEDFRIAVMMNPHDYKMRMNLALSYYHMEKYEYAAEHYEKIMTKWPNRPETYFKLSRTYIYLDKYNKALDVLSKGLELAPKAALDTITLADMMAERGHDQEALKAYQLIKGVKGKKNAMLHYKLGSVFKRLGDKIKAKQSLEQALNMDPENQMIQNCLRNLMEEK